MFVWQAAGMFVCGRLREWVAKAAGMFVYDRLRECLCMAG